MPQIQRSALVMYSADQMYRLVNDVSQYPEFLPNCADAKILSQQGDDMVASLQISKGGIQQWFTTKNTLHAGRKVEMSLEDGPFKSLAGGWEFLPLADNACKIVLTLQFEFSSKLIEAAFGRVFNSLTNSMVDAFTQRARSVYGEPEL